MESVWDSEGVMHVDFLEKSATINAQYYSNLICNAVHQAIQKIRQKTVKEGHPTA
jgi:hypothetical protein